jgi:hypothetical protein
MSQNMVEICTCTLGPSSNRLRVLISELRKFTNQDFIHHVMDDGTKDHFLTGEQYKVCKDLGSNWYTHGPPYGISYAWNACLEKVTSEWAFCIEDGLRPGLGWLETALDFIDKIGNRKWSGKRVAMAGCSSLQDWLLCLGGAFGSRDVMDVFRNGAGAQFWGPWNDGLWCWSRMLPQIMKACEGDTITWTNDVAQFLELTRGAMPDCLHPVEKEQRWQKWRLDGHWPTRRGAFCGWYPGFFALIHVPTWREVGRFRDGVSFLEGHLGVRLGIAGHLVLCLESVPFLHSPSLGFKASDFGKSPRHHEDTREAFLRDFGHDNMDSPNILGNAVTPLDEQKRINEELAKVELWMHDEWRKWL